jgi:hypothetical protein
VKPVEVYAPCLDVDYFDDLARLSSTDIIFDNESLTTQTIVSLPELQSDFNLIKTKLKEIKSELHTHFYNGYQSCPDDRFYEVMTPFIESAEKEFAKAEAAMATMSTLYKDVVKFYGEDASIMKPDEFFGIFKTFTASFEVRLIRLVIYMQ